MTTPLTLVLAEIILVFMIFVIALVFDVRLESQFTLPKLMAMRVFTIALIICWLYHYKKQTLLPISKPFLILTVAFGVWLILSTIKAYHVPTALWGDYGWYNGLYTQLNYLVLMLIVATLPIDVKKILKAFVIAASFVALYACLQWIGIDPLKFPNERPTSTIGNAVPMAAMIALAIPFCLYFMLNPMTKKTRSGIPSPPNFLWYIPFFICLFGIIVSASRGVQIAVLASCLMFFLSTSRHKMIVYIVIVCIAIAGITAYSIKSERYNINKAISGDSVQQRVQYAKTARTIIKKHPLVGVGPDNFVIAYPMYRDKALPNEKNLQTMVVHNGYLDLAVKSGIPALLLYLGLVGFVLFKLDKSKGLLATAFMAAILGFMIQALTGWAHLGLDPFFWIVIGLGINRGKDGRIK